MDTKPQHSSSASSETDIIFSPSSTQNSTSISQNSSNGNSNSENEKTQTSDTLKEEKYIRESEIRTQEVQINQNTELEKNQINQISSEMPKNIAITILNSFDEDTDCDSEHNDVDDKVGSVNKVSVEMTEEAPICQTSKEQDCWAMYRKMTKKGITVSYDTILRGMLTPTEYRMYRKCNPSPAERSDSLGENVTVN